MTEEQEIDMRDWLSANLKVDASVAQKWDYGDTMQVCIRVGLKRNTITGPRIDWFAQSKVDLPSTETKR